MGGSTDSDVLPRPLDFVVPLSSSDRILLDGIRTRYPAPLAKAVSVSDFFTDLEPV